MKTKMEIWLMQLHITVLAYIYLDFASVVYTIWSLPVATTLQAV